MKKILLLLFLSISAFSQTEKGMYTVSNSIFSVSSRLGGNYRYFELSPSVGKLIRNNLEYGVTLYIGSSRQKYSQEYEGRFALLNYFTKYFGRKKLQPYVNLGYGLMFDRKNQSGDVNLGLSGSVGVQYFVARNVSLGAYGQFSDLSIGGGYSSFGGAFNIYFLPKLKTINL